MTEKNNFRVKKFKEDKITVEEEKKYRSPFILFLLYNGRLIFSICLLLGITLFLISGSYIINNLKGSTIVSYNSDGTIVSFDGSDKTDINNNTPITDDYANKIFDNNNNKPSKNNTEDDVLKRYSKGVVIKVNEVKFNDGTIIYYSDNTALVKYNNGKYVRIYPVDGKSGIDKKGNINKKAITKEVKGEYKNNDSLGIKLLYLSDGSIEVTKDNATFFVRNSDITSLNNTFYTNLSGVASVKKEEGNKKYFSNGIIKEDNNIIVNNKMYEVQTEKVIHDNIKIIYYENGYAEIIKDDLDIIVEKSEHIIYDENILEIIDEKQESEIKIEDLIDIKNITLQNKNSEDAEYMIVLEETDNYSKHNVTNILPNKYIHYTLSLNGKKIDNMKLDNNIKGTAKAKGINFKNNAYLLYEGTLKKKSTDNIKLGLWVDYETITNEYMDSSFIGTIKVYVESK